MAGKLHQFSQLPMPWYLTASLAIGMGYGLIEASSALVLAHWHGALSWKSGTSIQALIYSPMIYGMAFLLIGLLFMLISRLVRWIPWDVVLVWFLATLSGYVFAHLTGRWFSEIAAVLIGMGLGAVAGRWYLARRDGRALRLSRAAPVLIVLVVLVGGLAQVGQAMWERIELANLPPADRRAPNILLLVLDTQRSDHLVSYGYDRPTTPRLSWLAQEGVLFQWAVSTAPTTLPSHASMFTGRPVADHRAGMDGQHYLDRRYPTIAELLRERGYATAGFVGNIFWTGRETGLARGFLHYEDFFGTPLDRVTRTILGRGLAYSLLPRFGMVDIPGRKRAATVNHELLRWLNQVPDHRPFFAFLNYFDVHAPYLPPARYLGRLSRPTYQANRIEIGAWNEHDRLPRPEVLREWLDRYDESLMSLDQEIGSLLDSLRARGRLTNTVVIVTSDHGESFGEHGMVHHGGSLYLEQIRVPLLIWGPGIVPENARVDAPIDLGSLSATIADIAGAESAGMPGRSLLHYADSIPDSVPPALSEAPEVRGNPKEWQTGRGWVMSLVTEHWHLLALESGEFELYDIVQDPQELNNLAQAQNHRATLVDLKKALPLAVPSTGSSYNAGEGQ